MIELNNKESEIAKNLKDLYKEIGFKHSSLNNRNIDILTFPTLSSITFSKANDKKNNFASFVRMTKKITKALFIAAISPMCIFYPLYHFYASGSFITSLLLAILFILCSINFITFASITKAN